GSPPFPGGDVADKLSRHCTAPPPDARQLRPEIPAPLALLIQRMMAKRPENRFANYEELLDEIDAVPTREEAPAGVPLYALIDDDDEGTEEDTSAPRQEEPLYALIDDEDDDADDELPVPRQEGPLFALIADDEDADDEGPTPGAGLALLDTDPASAA